MGLRLPNNVPSEDNAMPGKLEQLKALKARKQALLQQGNQVAANSMDEAIAYLEAQTNPQPPITAQPTTPDVTDAINQPFEDEQGPEDDLTASQDMQVSPENTPALATQVPEQKAAPSATPGTTVASQKAETEKQQDDYEPLFKDYEKAAQEYKTGTEALGKETEEVGRQQTMMTGISGALQAFGEGLAAITGGSAKPLQTGVQALQRVGEQQMAAQERKAKTLKERMMMAREPLEAKAQEIKFRDVFEQRQKAKRLQDPTSKESEDARNVANTFIDAVIGQYQNLKADTSGLMQAKQQIQKMNAAQVQTLMDNLNKSTFKPTMGAEEQFRQKSEIQAAKAEKASQERKERTAESQEFKTQQDAQKAIVQVQKEFDQDDKFYKQYNTFLTNLDKAIAGDKDAMAYIKNNQTAFSYMRSRGIESKGVFTDQDANRLDTMFNNTTWGEQFRKWVDGGFNGTIPMESLKKMREAIKDPPNDPNMVKDKKLKNYADIARNSTNPALQNSASYFERLMSKPTEPSQTKSTTVPTAAPTAAPTEKTFNSAEEAIKSGLLKEGDVISTKDNNTKYIYKIDKRNTKTRHYLEPVEQAKEVK